VASRGVRLTDLREQAGALDPEFEVAAVGRVQRLDTPFERLARRGGRVCFERDPCRPAVDACARRTPLHRGLELLPTGRLAVVPPAEDGVVRVPALVGRVQVEAAAVVPAGGLDLRPVVATPGQPEVDRGVVGGEQSRPAEGVEGLARLAGVEGRLAGRDVRVAGVVWRVVCVLDHGVEPRREPVGGGPRLVRPRERVGLSGHRLEEGRDGLAGDEPRGPAESGDDGVAPPCRVVALDPRSGRRERRVELVDERREGVDGRRHVGEYARRGRGGDREHDVGRVADEPVADGRQRERALVAVVAARRRRRRPDGVPLGREADDGGERSVRHARDTLPRRKWVSTGTAPPVGTGARRRHPGRAAVGRDPLGDPPTRR
jgi:hypothetical protein